MKAVMLTSDQATQRALAKKLSDVCDLSAIVISQNVPKKQKSPEERARILLNRVEGRLAGRPMVRAWQEMQARYKNEYALPEGTPIVRVSNVNNQETIEAIETHDPDVVIVSGTNMVGKGVVAAASKKLGILNMHTGISPYIKGGPNCTNWCLAENLMHLIGTTIMWLDLGIDTGSLIATERAPLDGSESFVDLHYKVMQHAHSMYVRAIKKMAAGEKLPKIPQESIAEGRTFYTKEWSLRPMLRAQLNFKLRYKPSLFQSEDFKRKCASVKLFPLDT